MVTAGYRGLGFNPVPGSVDAVVAASRRYTEVAAQAGAAAPAVRHAREAPGDWWTGTAAQAFAARLERTPSELAAAEAVLRAGADILDEWAGVLVANQRRADELDRRALRLRRAIADASDEVGRATTAAQLAGGPNAEADRSTAVTRHDELRRALDQVLETARALEQEHAAAARRTAERLSALRGDIPPQRDTAAAELSAVLHTHRALGQQLATALLGAPGAGDPPPSGVHAFTAALGTGEDDR